MVCTLLEFYNGTWSNNANTCAQTIGCGAVTNQYIHVKIDTQTQFWMANLLLVSKSSYYKNLKMSDNIAVHNCHGHTESLDFDTVYTPEERHFHVDFRHVNFNSVACSVVKWHRKV